MPQKNPLSLSLSRLKFFRFPVLQNRGGSILFEGYFAPLVPVPAGNKLRAGIISIAGGGVLDAYLMRGGAGRPLGSDSVGHRGFPEPPKRCCRSAEMNALFDDGCGLTYAVDGGFIVGGRSL